MHTQVIFCGESLYIFPMNLHPQFCTLHCPDKIKCDMHTQVMFCGEMTKETQNTLIQEFHVKEYSSSYRDKTHLNCFTLFFFFCFLWVFFLLFFFLFCLLVLSFRDIDDFCWPVAVFTRTCS